MATVKCQQNLEKIYIDSQTDLLPDPGRIKVFIDEETAEAFSNLICASEIETTQKESFKSNAVKLKPNSEILWDGQGWKILNVGDSAVSIINDSDETLRIQKKIFEKLVQNGDIAGINSLDEKTELNLKIQEILGKSSKKELKIANDRFEIIKSHLEDNLCENIAPRTLREWKARHRNAEIQFGLGMGYLGLIPKSGRGNASAKIPLEKF